MKKRIVGVRLFVMKKMTINVFLGAAIGLLLCISLVTAAAQQKAIAQSTTPAQPGISTSEVADQEGIPPGHVVIDGRQVLTVYEPVGTFTPEERADRIGQRIIAAITDRGISPEAIRLQPRQAWTEIVLGDEVVMAVTDVDAKMAGKSRQQLVTEDADSIRQAIQNYRLEHSWRLILRGVLYTVLATFALWPVLWFLRRTAVALRDRVEKRIQANSNRERGSPRQISVAYLAPLALTVGSFFRWLFILAVIEAYLTVVLGFFPHTRSISLSATRWLFSQLGFLAESALDYLPNVMVVAVIALITHYAIRLLRLIFGEIQRGDLKIRGFYPDWAGPTDKLVRMLVLALALIVAFPYLPGAQSSAFRGVSIFLGLLLSLGSSSAVANAIAGVILTYMRSFLVGDWVQIGDTTGEVIEKNMLVTRVLNPKAEIITIPNATVMSGAVKNYSIEARKSGVIFHTTVTIGYDVPWRTVHQLLIKAALATQDVLQQPTPYVLQKALNDFYVSYELNVYTDAPSQGTRTYSELHQNIQDKFNEAGVEICSPHFAALRDGNTIAIPGEYIKPDYKAPGFRLNSTATEE
jgi:small-conductance mechanosensitive channel